MKLFNSHVQAVNRRKATIKRLEEQQERGTKYLDTKQPDGTVKREEIPLTDEDKQRIKQELITLKSRV